MPEVGVTGKALEEKSPLGILFAFKVDIRMFLYFFGGVDAWLGEWERWREVNCVSAGCFVAPSSFSVLAAKCLFCLGVFRLFRSDLCDGW